MLLLPANQTNKLYLQMVEETAQVNTTTSSSNQSGSNDFVKKLYQMLQEDSYKEIVRWTKNGDSFVVLDTNEFTKEVLPRHFKHSNFASFVRQLNKYDFHKVKIPNEEKQFYEYGEDAWEFKHSDFRVNDRDALENIKRKGPSSKKAIGNDSITSNITHNLAQLQMLREEIDYLKTENKTLTQEMNILKTKYKALIENIVSIKSFDERYYRSMNILLNCLMQAGIKLPALDFPNPNLIGLQQSQQQKPQQNSLQISQLSPPIASPNSNTPSIQQGIPQPNFDASFIHNQAHVQQQMQLQLPHHQVSQPSDTLSQKIISPPQDLNVQSPGINNNLVPTQQRPPLSTTATLDGLITNIPNPKFHVLLVEDDNVCIQLCRKFLMKYGCQVTVVTDGLNAISTVENTKYDLVLMDIVMPNLDGATATSVIRSFDTKTPIIAMTGNIEDNDLVTYLQNGMSDILAKPFTKDDLYSILSKHLLSPEVKNDSPNLNIVPKNEILDGLNARLLSDAGDHILKKQRLT